MEGWKARFSCIFAVVLNSSSNWNRDDIVHNTVGRVLHLLAIAACMPASSPRACAKDMKWTPLSLPSSAFSLFLPCCSPPSARHCGSRKPWPLSCTPWSPRSPAPSPWPSVRAPLLADARPPRSSSLHRHASAGHQLSQPWASSKPHHGQDVWVIVAVLHPMASLMGSPRNAHAPCLHQNLEDGFQSLRSSQNHVTKE